MPDRCPEDAEGHADIVRLIPALRAFARTFHGERADADDLVQETLVKALANIDKFEAGTQLKSWLFTIMRNTFCSRAKRASREIPGLEDYMDNMVLPPGQEWSLRGRELGRAFRQLPDQSREIIMLVVVLGESYETAAEICDCAVGTVKSRLNRARHQLLAELGEEEECGAA